MLQRKGFAMRTKFIDMDVRGSAAVEFALLLPLMLLLFLAALQLSQTFTVARNFDSLTHTLADITSRQTESPSRDGNGYLNSYAYAANSTVTVQVLDNILASAAAIMAPFPTSSLGMTITAVDVVNTAGNNGQCCQFFVRWSYSTAKATLRPCQTLTTAANPSGVSQISLSLIPAAGSNIVLSAPAAIIIADTTDTYVPLLNNIFLGSVIKNSGGAAAPLDMTVTMSRTQYVYPRNIGQIVLAETGTSTQTGTISTSMPTTYPSSTSQSFTGSQGTGVVCY